MFVGHLRQDMDGGNVEECSGGEEHGDARDGRFNDVHDLGGKGIRAVITPNALMYIVEVNVCGDITLLIRDDSATAYII